ARCNTNSFQINLKLLRALLIVCSVDGIKRIQKEINQRCSIGVRGENVNVVKVPGEKTKHKIIVYALSTCVWCRQVKNFLKQHKVEYEYVDVDLCNREDREKIKKEILKRGGSFSFPTVIVDEKVLIEGFREDKLKDVLEL
ncbi:MAG: glutaredoxin family protein, partial [Methanomassiliicoccales archaeon]|nr:glutaredoxin family protein [Methanomassiliicoccales archaeon]